MKPDFLKKENRPVQYFSEEYLAECQKMSLQEIIYKISDQQDLFWKMHAEKNEDESTLISLKVPKKLLTHFRKKCEQQDFKYQTQIKNLMISWVLK